MNPYKDQRIVFHKICLLSLHLFIAVASVLIGLSVVFAGPLDAMLDPRISSWAQDSDGNLHYFWVADDGAVARLYYRMVGSTGLTVIDSRLIDQVHAKVRRPQVLAYPGHQVHFLWQERSLAPAPAKGKNKIHYARFQLDPASFFLQSLDHRVLNARADLSAKHPRMALNRRGDVAVVWEDPQTGILLMKLDPTGRSGVPTIIVPGPFQAPVQPSITADRLGRLHIAWASRSSKQSKTSRIFYTMVSGQRFKPLIRPTALSFVPQTLKSVSIDIADGKRLQVGWSVERTGGVYRRMAPDGSVSFDLVRKNGPSNTSWSVRVRDMTGTRLTPIRDRHPRFVTDGMVLREPVLRSSLAPVTLQSFHSPPVHKPYIAVHPRESSNELLRFNLWPLAPPVVLYSI